MRRLSWKVMTLTVGLLWALSFVLCVIYGLIVPARLHASALLETVLPGFRWLTAGSFVLGVVETFVYGSYVGFVFTLLYNWLSRRLESPESV